MEEVISFNRGVPATSSLHPDEVSDAAAAVLEEDGKNVLQYGDSRGYPPLRQEVADKYGGDSRAEVLVGNGSLQILDSLAHVYLSPGDAVLVEKPSYDRSIKIFDRVGVNVFGVEMEKDGVNLGKFADMVDRVDPKLFYTVPDFHNPTGITTSGKKRKRVAEMARDAGMTIIEDSPYRRLRYSGEDEPTYRSIAPDCVVQMSSVSKLISPGIRVGWIIAREELIDEVARFSEDTYITPSLLSQGVVSHLMRTGWVEENVKRLVDLYKPRLDATLSSLGELFSQADWVEARGGFFVGLWLPEGTDVEKFYGQAKNEGLTLSSPKGFYPDYDGERFVRLPFPALKPEEIEAGVSRLASIWENV